MVKALLVGLINAKKPYKSFWQCESILYKITSKKIRIECFYLLNG